MLFILCGTLFSSNECERESRASAIFIPVECSEHESLPMTSTQFLSCKNLRVNSVDTHGTSCQTTAEQLNKDYQILVMLGPDAPEEQKLDMSYNFAKLNLQPTYKFPAKVEYGKNVHFSITTYKLTLGWDILLHWSTRKKVLGQVNPRVQENTKDSGMGLLTF